MVAGEKMKGRSVEAVSRADEEVLIEAGRGMRHYWLDLWRYRELFAFLAWRDLAVRYKQTAIGIAWALLRPLVIMIVFTEVFGSLAGLSDETPGDAPYAIVVFAALLPWQFFASSLGDSSASLVDNANMIGKVYFPRLTMPASTVIVNLADFAISFVLLLFLMLVLRHPPSIRMLALPPLILLAIAAALGAGIWMAALNVKYRDFRYVVPFIVQLGLYVSPVGFPEHRRARAVAARLLAQSYGRGDRRFPMGDPGSTGRHLLARIHAVDRPDGLSRLFSG